MFLKNSKPLWKHVFTNTVFLCFHNYFRLEKNHIALGTYRNNKKFFYIKTLQR